ncbi:MAG: hypothetical protein ABIB79_05110 [archaeon]
MVGKDYTNVIKDVQKFYPTEGEGIATTYRVRGKGGVAVVGSVEKGLVAFIVKNGEVIRKIAFKGNGVGKEH